MFSIRQVIQAARLAPPVSRCMSAHAPLVGLSVDNSGLAILTLQKPPVNSFGLDMVLSIGEAIEMAKKDNVRALIITSALPTVFSAGLDLAELIDPDLEKLERFIRALQDLWIKLYGLDIITAAAINGHSPTAGCFLALTAEYRAMVDGDFRIGFNETQLNVAVPAWIIDGFTAVVPPPYAESALTGAKLFNVQEALKVGLIDDIAEDREDAIEKCKKFIARFNNIPAIGRKLTKERLRRENLERARQHYLENFETFKNNITSEETQNTLKEFIEKLKSDTK